MLSCEMPRNCLVMTSLGPCNNYTVSHTQVHASPGQLDFWHSLQGEDGKIPESRPLEDFSGPNRFYTMSGPKTKTLRRLRGHNPAFQLRLSGGSAANPTRVSPNTPFGSAKRHSDKRRLCSKLGIVISSHIYSEVERRTATRFRADMRNVPQIRCSTLSKNRSQQSCSFIFLGLSALGLLSSPPLPSS